VEPFADRRDAGRRLAERLKEVLGERQVVVVGLPRGGVPVALEVARELRCPLDVIMVRKVGVPWQPEVAMGALGEDDVLVVENETVKAAKISDSEFQRAVATARKELRRRLRTYRRSRGPVRLANEVVVIIDDGLATGATALAACRVARARGARSIIAATPVSSNGAATRLERVVDEFVTLERVGGPFAVGQWYEDFGATSDQEVIADLKVMLAATDSASPRPRGAPNS
jgi:putative phosphoribosyl transferase